MIFPNEADKKQEGFYNFLLFVKQLSLAIPLEYLLSDIFAELFPPDTITDP
jgi:hypothetical protein